MIIKALSNIPLKTFCVECNKKIGNILSDPDLIWNVFYFRNSDKNVEAGHSLAARRDNSRKWRNLSTAAALPVARISRVEWGFFLMRKVVPSKKLYLFANVHVTMECNFNGFKELMLKWKYLNCLVENYLRILKIFLMRQLNRPGDTTTHE